VRVRVEWKSLRHTEGRIEVLRNGSVVASKAAEVDRNRPAVFETTVDFQESGWLAARRMDWQSGHKTHTGAAYVAIRNQPIRASAADAEFFVKWIDNLIRQTSPGGAWSEFLTDDRVPAHARYERAKAIYAKIASEARARTRSQP